MQAADHEAEWFLNPAFSRCSGAWRHTAPTQIDPVDVRGGLMKRAAVVGTILVSLMAGGAAMADQGFHGAPDHRDPPRVSFHERHDWNTDHSHNDRGRYDDRDRY